jgi:hypothetical protein
MKVSMPLMSGGALRLTEVTDAQEKQVEDLMFLCPRCRAGRCDGYGFLVPLTCGFAEHRANLLEEYRKTAPKRAVAEAEAYDLRVCVRQLRPFSVFPGTPVPGDHGAGPLAACTVVAPKLWVVWAPVPQ